jgi:hypothetical protein
MTQSQWEPLMTDPREPLETPPLPTPDGRPEPPIEEPEPDRLPDETPNPNPDENNPPAYA